jgi:hypothetical protein
VSFFNMLFARNSLISLPFRVAIPIVAPAVPVQDASGIF